MAGPRGVYWSKWRDRPLSLRRPAVLPTPAAKVAGAYATGTGWTAASGVSVTNGGALTKAHPSGRTTGLVLVKNPTSGTFSAARAPTLTPFRMRDIDFLGMDILPQIISGSVTLRVSSDNFAAKRLEYSWPFPSEIYNGDWNRITARTAADGTIDPNGGTWVSTGGMTTDDLVNAFQISINSVASDAARVEVDRVVAFSGSPARGAVMFGFDRYEDTSLPALALPIAQRQGITCYAAGDTDKVAPMGAAWTRVKQLHDAGWPIISQGPDHKDYVVAGAAQLTTDVATSRATLTTVGLTNALDFFAYPLSSNNAATDAALLAATFKMASTGIAWNGHPNEYNLGFKLIGQGRVNIGDLTLTQVKRLIDRAAYYGVVVDLFCHGLTAGGTGTAPPADPLLWYADDWEAAIVYAKTLMYSNNLDITNPVALFAARGALPVLA